MERLCEYCREPFIPKRSDAKHCSHSCRQLAYVLRKAIKAPGENLNELTVKSEASINGDKINAKQEELTDNEKQVSIQAKEAQEHPSIESEININESNKVQLAVNTDKKPKLILNFDSLKAKADKEKIEEKYIEYESSFVRELIDLTESRGYSEKLSHIFYHGSIPAKWVSVRYKCLLECLLTFSEMRDVALDDLKEVCNNLTSVILSTYFRSLPLSYPYLKEIIGLRDSLKRVCIQNDDDEGEEGGENDVFIKFRFKPGTKKELIATRYELSQLVPKKHYSELFTE